jgi:RNase P/RNase MRP subunit p29
MKRTALLALAVFLLVAGPATAAPRSVKGVVVAKRAHGTIVVATGRKGLAVTVRAATRRVRLGDRVNIVGTHLHVVSHVKKARIQGLVVKRLAHSLRVASGHSILTIHTRSRALASHHDGGREGQIGEFEIEFRHDGLFEHGFTAGSASGTVRIEGRLVSASPLVVSIEGLPIEITVPNGMTLPPLTPGQEVELTVQAGAGNVFTLVSIQAGDDEDQNEVEATGTVTDSTTSQITIDADGAMLTFAAPAGETLPVIATGTLVEARGVTIDGVLTLTRLRTDDDADGGGGGGDGGGGGH